MNHLEVRMKKKEGKEEREEDAKRHRNALEQVAN